MAYHCGECNHPSDTRHGMAMHLLNSKAHSSIDSFDEAETKAGDMEESHPAEHLSDTSASEDNSGGSDGTETDVSPTTFPESDKAQEPTTDAQPDVKQPDTVPDCPGCGSTEIATADETLDEYRTELSGEHIALIESSDYVCTDCGGVFDS